MLPIWDLDLHMLEVYSLGVPGLPILGVEPHVPVLKKKYRGPLARASLLREQRCGTRDAGCALDGRRIKLDESRIGAGWALAAATARCCDSARRMQLLAMLINLAKLHGEDQDQAVRSIPRYVAPNVTQGPRNFANCARPH